MTVRVLIVDDSALMRQMLQETLERDPEIEVVDTASDPLIAREKIKKYNPDVLTLDVEMPRMNGIDFLCRLMALRPMPVIMVSSLTLDGSDATLRALELGAFDYVAKPDGFIADGLAELGELLREKVKAAARIRVSPVQSAAVKRIAAIGGASGRLIAIGASTGGVPAVGSILEALPEDMPPIVIAQHMPPGFTARFAERVNAVSELKVVEARDGMSLKAGHAYVAPGGFQTRVTADRRLSVRDEGRVNGFCPCVDLLFESVARHEGSKGIGLILTGMGRDGAAGLWRMRKAGAMTFGQDERTSLIYGMPRVAFESGAVCRQMPLEKMAAALVRECSPSSRQPAALTQSRFPDRAPL